MDDLTLALLGDKEAQERITERGELLPCQCGGNAKCQVEDARATGIFKYSAIITCKKCEISLFSSGETAREAFETAAKTWNTRAPLLTPEQIKRLEDTHGE